MGCRLVGLDDNDHVELLGWIGEPFDS